ncbi:hypothetical protein CEXT_1181 [Caerostris extrusa]|uniref:Uncharacterized protein n=1 Tax=Caerostris extrusa TaxID=172846 RepID=A0AAV4UU15_CAEEX|nr:hypothetical protein CEXT_1181 [Caerostris extrusa]
MGMHPTREKIMQDLCQRKNHTQVNDTEIPCIGGKEGVTSAQLMDYPVDLDLPEQPNQRRSSAPFHFIGRSAPIESCVLPLPKVFNPVFFRFCLWLCGCRLLRVG